MEYDGTGFGQCIAEMVAAQKFNERQEKSIPIIYGSVSLSKSGHHALKFTPMGIPCPYRTRLYPKA